MALVKCSECGAPNQMNKTQHESQNDGNGEDNSKTVSDKPVENVSKANKHPYLKIIVVIAIIIMLVVTGVIFFFRKNEKASDQKIQQEAENQISTANLIGIDFAVHTAKRSEETGMPTIVYVTNFSGGSSEFRGMSSSQREEYDAAMEKVMKLCSEQLSDRLGEKVVLCICVMSSQKNYKNLGYTEYPELVATYYDYGDEAKNEQVKKKASDQIESDYNQLIEMVKNKKYREAINFYTSSKLSETSEGYSDSKKYFFYAEAMNYYSLTCYGEAYDMLEKCEGILDTADVLKEIEDKVFYLDGVYKNISINYDMYLCIYHGKTHVEIGAKPTEVSYSDTLMNYTFTTGKTVYAMGYAFPGDEVAKTNYVIEEFDDGDLVVAGAPGADYTTYSGAYKKISSTPVKAK